MLSAFYDTIRLRFGPLSQSQVDGINVCRDEILANNFPAPCAAKPFDVKISAPETSPIFVGRKQSSCLNQKIDKPPIEMEKIDRQWSRQSNLFCFLAPVEFWTPNGSSPPHSVLAGQSDQSSSHRHEAPYRQEIERMIRPIPSKRECPFRRILHNPYVANRSIAA